jgi:hypothetical protein
MPGLAKTEGGISYPARCFLDVPDPRKPSTWGLRIYEMVNGEIKMTKAQLGRAAAALSSNGYRGNAYKTRPVGKSNDQLKASLVSKYRSLGVSDDEIPSYLLSASHMAHARWRPKRKKSTMDEFIEHVGIKGMKWGIRKDYRTGGQKLSDKAKNMSEQDLSSSIKRMQMERQYADLIAKENKANQSRLSAGKERVGKILIDGGAEAAKTVFVGAAKGSLGYGAKQLAQRDPTIKAVLDALKITEF